MIISSYHHIIVLSPDHNTKWLKSFSVPSLGCRHILSRLPLLQGSLPKNKGTSGNNFLRRTCQRGKKNRSSSKTPFSWKKNRPRKFLKKFYPNFFSGVEKWKVANRLKRVLPKFHADRSHVRGVNGRLKFRRFFGGAIFFFFPARHGTGRGGAEAPEKKKRMWLRGNFFYDVGVT